MPPSVRPDTVGRLTTIVVDGLLGRPEMTIDTPPAGPMLLTGANGSGKSTLLRLLDDAAHGRWLRVREHAFTQLSLGFASGAHLRIAREHDGLWVALDDQPVFLAREMLQRARQRKVVRDRRAIEMGRPIPPEQEILFSDEESEAFPPWVRDVPNLFPVLFIEDQRLVLKSQTSDPYAPQPYPGRKSNAPHAAVRRFPQKLRSEIQGALSAYAAHSQELDRRFPMRVAEAIEAEHTQSESEAAADLIKLRALIVRVREERQALQRVGLLGTEEGPEYFDDRRLEAGSVRPVIRVFAEDTLAKFEVLRELRVRLELFIAFLNQHYQDKRVVTTRDSGFTITMDDGRQLRPWELSSGEQQVLALAFEVLFASRPGTLILIDEPELSLHVLWQSTLIADLEAMGAARQVQFILATHSPTLIGDRVELMRPLDAARDESHTRPSGDTTDFDRLIEFDDESDYVEDDSD